MPSFARPLALAAALSLLLTGTALAMPPGKGPLPDPDEIGPFVQKCGIADKVKHRKLIIPGYAAQISGELEEELPGWEIVIGPREAAHIPSFLKS